MPAQLFQQKNDAVGFAVFLACLRRTHVSPKLRYRQAVLIIHRRWRPYRVECTESLPTSEVKRRRARLVLGWGTAREVLRVLTAFASRRPVFQLPPRMTTIMLPTFRANALLLARPRVSSFQVDALFQVASCSPGGSLINAVPDASCKAPPSLKSNPKPSNSHPATSQCRIIRWPHASGEAKAM